MPIKEFFNDSPDELELDVDLDEIELGEVEEYEEEKLEELVKIKPLTPEVKRKDTKHTKGGVLHIKCKRCRIKKPLHSFQEDMTYPLGRKPWCYVCCETE